MSALADSPLGSSNCYASLETQERFDQSGSPSLSPVGWSQESEKCHGGSSETTIGSLSNLRQLYIRSPTSPLNQLMADLHPLDHLVIKLPYQMRKRILVTGGAGFVGSHLVDRLMLQGHEVVALDNFFTGNKRNVEHWLGHRHFELIRHDIVNPIFMEVDQIYHLACPASPPHYQLNAIKTIKTNVLGTLNMLGLAKRVKGRLLITSTSEVYGDPTEHPQPETYWGHVNPIGPRACYDEGKRVAETLVFAYANQNGVDARIARIFNTYGPRMNPEDGRVISNFILQALEGKPITIYGTGDQTRSLQYVQDLVTGLISLMESNCMGPVNIGNPDEYTVLEIADLVRKVVGGGARIEHLPGVVDDPQKRRPDISKAREELGWQPQVTATQGIAETVEYFRGIL